MSCHTWFGSKINRTLEEGIELAIYEIDSIINETLFASELLDIQIKYDVLEFDDSYTHHDTQFLSQYGDKIDFINEYDSLLLKYDNRYDKFSDDKYFPIKWNCMCVYGSTIDEYKTSLINLLEDYNAIKSGFINGNYKIKTKYYTDFSCIKRIEADEKEQEYIGIDDYQPEDLIFWIEDKNAFYEYVNDKYPHDIFRIGYNKKFPEPYNSYCETFLFSRKEMFDFIDEQHNREQFELPHWYIEILDQNQIKKLNKFWDEYPDGFIHFG